MSAKNRIKRIKRISHSTQSPQHPTGSGFSLKSRIVKTVGAGLLAATLLGATTHLGLRHFYGPSYPKRIPLVTEIYADRRASIAFSFSSHHTVEDSRVIIPILEKAKAEGKSYNVLIIESGEVLIGEREEAEKLINRQAQEMTEEQRDFSISEILKQDPKDEQGLCAYVEQLYIAHQYGLRIKIGEEYSSSEAEKLSDLYRVAFKPKQKIDTTIEYAAEAARLRDPRIAQTCSTVISELKNDPRFQGKPIRVLGVFGTAHLGSAKMFDKLSRIRHVEVFHEPLTNEAKKQLELSRKPK